MDKGKLIVISGPAGVGKGTVIRHLLEVGGGDFAFSVSATTRQPRPGEENGREYFFVSKEEFRQRAERGDMLEWAEYVGNYYGTPREAVEQVLASGRHVILEIEVEGALQVKSRVPDALLIMIGAPDFAIIEARLRGRGTNTEEDIQRRLKRAREELDLVGEFGYLVTNHDGASEAAAAEIMGIVEGGESVFGSSKGKMQIAEDFDEPLEELQEYM
ncbi:MAG: guanylate kinase [Oscillospiraceae bacterium]|nr:guanylate kinase [Oscillospiraceae bacterium]